MADPIHLAKFADQSRQVRGRGALPERNQARHGRYLESQLARVIRTIQDRTRGRSTGLPLPPTGAQVLIKGATTAAGAPLLESAKLRGLKLEVLEERRDGLVVVLSPDPTLSRLNTAITDFRTDARSEPTPQRPHGTRKRGVRTVFSIDDVEASARELRMGDELGAIAIDSTRDYLVDIEIAAGTELQDEGRSRRAAFLAYLQQGQGAVQGAGPIVEVDYALYRARIPGPLLEDLLDVHPWVLSVELPPIVEMEGLNLVTLTEPQIPPLSPPDAAKPGICIIDSGVVTEHPLLLASMQARVHRSFVPDNPGIGDAGPVGHGTAVASIAALGSLRTALLRGGAVEPVGITLARILDDQAKLPESINLKSVIPTLIDTVRGEDGIFIFSHSIASRGRFNRARMSVWAETIDKAVYDDGGEGCLFITCTGNVDTYHPAPNQTVADLQRSGHPSYLLDESYRLRNPAHAINALTVGAYSSGATPGFVAMAHGLTPIAAVDNPSPFTRSGLGYLGEIKPEIVEEGGNWYNRENGTIDRTPRVTDVATAAHDFATTGRLVRFGAGTSWAAPKAAHLAALIAARVPTTNPDLIRAIIVNSASWPAVFGNNDDHLRLFGYGVPNPIRALEIEGPRSLILIEDSIRIGNVHFYRIPWPEDILEDSPDTHIRLSITLSYRSPVRKSSQRYKGTSLEWKCSKIGETFEGFRTRCVFQGVAAPEDDDEAEEEIVEGPIGDWPWEVRTNLRKRGTAQKDWCVAPATFFHGDLFLAVIGKRGWLSKQTQDQGFDQRYAMAVTIEVEGQVVPLHERIQELVQIPVTIPIAG